MSRSGKARRTGGGATKQRSANSRSRAAARIELAPQYDPSRVESAIYRQWDSAGVFQPRPRTEPYVIVIPPPNVTGVLHMGHALNNTLQDVLIRFERMRGRAALYLPGTDHAGIATQNVVERLIAKEGKTRFHLGRDRFVERVWEYVRETGQTILEQLKAIGASCDWTRTRFTLDPEYSKAVRHVFVTLWEEGLVYRGHRVIHWCSRCLTALSDEEAEFHEAEGKLYYIRYPVAGEDGRYVVVATTRPETMLGDTAVAVHPSDSKTSWAKDKRVRLPLTEISLPLIADEAVDPEFGTGFVKVTPAHDATDFEIGLRHGLAMPLVMDEEGRMKDPAAPEGRRVPPELEGRDRFEARELIVEMLRRQGLLEKIKSHRHAVRRCYRCDTVVEPRLSDQWFVKMAPLAQPALEAYRAGRLRFVPERWGNVYQNWLENIRDWNISRQLWWGHRIPVFTCQSCGEQWADRSDPERCRKCGGGPVVQDPDVLDTWFSSWLWPFATLGWPQQTPDLERFYPGHTLVTGSEIIFFWVARMVMAGYHFLGERPFETVLINGTVRDTLHRRMSKSLGNGIDPLEVVRLYGADALRFTLVAGAPVGTDLILDPNDLETTFAPGRNFVNKVWNAGRLLLATLQRTPVPLEEIDPEKLELADRWILSRTQRAVASVTDALERFRLADAANAGYHFLWDELADWYLEQVKPRLYGKRPGATVAKSVACYAFETALRLLHPVIPFVTEELWHHFPGRDSPLLATAAWPSVNHRWIDPDAEDRFGRVQALVGAVRAVRAEYGVHPSSEVRAVVRPSDRVAQEAFRAERQTIQRLARIAKLTLKPGGQPGSSESEAGAHTVLPDGSSVFVALGDVIDLKKECARLGKELERIDQQLEGVRRKLANSEFVQRAPAEVVDRERAKERSLLDRREVLATKLRALGC
ncbi:MAG: valine--tRNA ligase [Gemmatimonadales bacterium]|nr:MAG: valine--tRNA ligase [Gemmatimonadales bacterium]